MNDPQWLVLKLVALSGTVLSLMTLFITLNLVKPTLKQIIWKVTHRHTQFDYSHPFEILGHI